MNAYETKTRKEISDLLRSLIPLIDALCTLHPTKRKDLLATVGRLVVLMNDGTTTKKRTKAQDIPEAELDALFNKGDSSVTQSA